MGQQLDPKVRDRFLEVVEMLKKNGAKDSEIAKKLEISKGCISQYRHKKRVPDTKIIIKLSELTHIPTDYFYKK